MCRRRGYETNHYWNVAHPNDKHTIEDMFIPRFNVKVGSWYLEHRIPEMLNHYGKPLSVENIIISWNAGIEYVRNGRTPKSTKRYLKRYFTGKGGEY
jgi:soluble lytic murein transglycosylase-like protein